MSVIRTDRSSMLLTGNVDVMYHLEKEKSSFYCMKRYPSYWP